MQQMKFKASWQMKLTMAHKFVLYSKKQLAILLYMENISLCHQKHSYVLFVIKTQGWVILYNLIIFNTL